MEGQGVRFRAGAIYIKCSRFLQRHCACEITRRRLEAEQHFFQEINGFFVWLLRYGTREVTMIVFGRVKCLFLLRPRHLSCLMAL